MAKWSLALSSGGDLIDDLARDYAGLLIYWWLQLDWWLRLFQELVGLERFPVCAVVGSNRGGGDRVRRHCGCGGGDVCGGDALDPHFSNAPTPSGTPPARPTPTTTASPSTSSNHHKQRKSTTKNSSTPPTPFTTTKKEGKKQCDYLYWIDPPHTEKELEAKIKALLGENGGLHLKCLGMEIINQDLAKENNKLITVEAKVDSYKWKWWIVIVACIIFWLTRKNAILGNVKYLP
ncbi:uncharacterized protein LOC131328510 [Rhododendron vialii]|uniref:uncharacterized protein LOC131328510 n=1 Tax=Rhododendron vialii TaxID=182163 RepID=UPI00265EB0D5|nr:uncharacterized protein LOC131328510 [Rhododendron vialii]